MFDLSVTRRDRALIESHYVDTIFLREAHYLGRQQRKSCRSICSHHTGTAVLDPLYSSRSDHLLDRLHFRAVQRFPLATAHCRWLALGWHALALAQPERC